MNSTGFHTLTVSHVRAETDSSICVTFHLPEDLEEAFRFKQGQFLTMKAEIDKEEVRRSYSICSGVHDGHLRVGIKRVNGGRFSNFANDNFKPGFTVDVMPPQGNFYTELNPENKKNYMLIAAGSGITPILSNIKTILHVEPLSQVTLLYGNLRSNSVMFMEELGFIKNRYMSRFQWINIMDNEDQGADLLNGIIDNKKGAELYKNKLIDIKNTDEAFICGPQAMMSEISRGFRSMGFDDTSIHYELFTSSSEDSKVALDKYTQRIADYGEQKTSDVTIISGGRAINFDLAAVGENILDAGMHNGLDLPYACKAGVCSTCKAKLVEGEVDMDINHALEPAELEAGYILTCQSHPISNKVIVDFDQ
ncbi:MAG: phenylacetate-CoA oxygenase/reductase subunit PaaK [Gammaproteobacteria bacterium]|nr:phenylacetate-CoA oxygenase/reductase subunit PaaK [Gammaproteobacteria bacterium]